MPDETITAELGEVQCRTLKEMLLYKMDRTLAVTGIILLSGFALWLRMPETTAAGGIGIGALASYIGSKTAK